MFSLTEKDLEDPDVLGRKLIQLNEIIVRKHFYASYKDKDDLVSVGVLKMLDLINEGNWDKSKGSLCNYLYSGARNSIHNYLYHQNKFPLIDQEQLRDSGISDNYFSGPDCPISYGLVHSVCMHFTDAFGEGIEDAVISKLEEIGYTLEGRVKQSPYSVGYSSVLSDRYKDYSIDDIVGRIIGLILWKKKSREE
jgi:hypothetical protein